MQEFVLSLDIGTTVIKSVLFNNNGEEVFTYEKKCKTISPYAGFMEQDPEEIWAIVIESLQASVKHTKNDQVIQAISIATQGGSIVPVDQNGEAIYNLITWMDNRAADLVKEWESDGTANLIRSISGWKPQPGLPLAVITWLKRFKPNLCKQAKFWLSINDFIIHKLTDTFATNPSMAGEMLLTDINTGQWSIELCHLAGIHPEQLSKIFPSHEIIGKITKTCSQTTGLDEGLPVINGGQDHACEALALGIIDFNETFLACGTAWVINTLTNTGSIEKIPQNMDLNFHVIPKRWITSQFLGNLGSYSEWCLNLFWKSNENMHNTSSRFKLMNDNLNQLKKVDDKLIFLPFNKSQISRNNSNSGGFFGIRFDHDQSHLTRAVLESAGFEVHRALKLLENEGFRIHQLWMIGGASHSPIWPQILADINGIDIIISSYTHGPALGAAVLAWLGLGIYNNIEECSNHIKLDKKIIHPVPENQKIYRKKFILYQNFIIKYQTF